jgi:hypothetical protein
MWVYIWLIASLTNWTGFRHRLGNKFEGNLNTSTVLQFHFLVPALAVNPKLVVICVALPPKTED